MRPQPARLGPFTGGINHYSDPSAIDDTELADCINFQLDMDGSLVCRPVFRRANQTATPGDPFPFGGLNAEIIGQGVWPSGVRLFAANANGTWALASREGQWSKISNDQMNVACQVAGMVCMVPNVATKGFYWSPTQSLPDANIPRGRMALYFKGRLWVAPGRNPPDPNDESKLKYTNPIDQFVSATKPVWGSANSIQIQPGDGQDLTDMVVYQDQLILFKNDSTYVHAYDTGEPKDGLVRVANTVVGASTRDCVTQYEDATYVMHQGNIYEIVNYNFTHINDKVPFVIDAKVPSGTTRSINVGISVVGDQLICRYFNRMYVFGLRTRVWTRYESTNGQLQNVHTFWPWPTNTVRDTPIYYYAGSTIDSYGFITECVDGPRTADIFETVDYTTRLPISCKIITKTFDMGDSFHFKKLKWWGADVLTNTDIVGEAQPIVIRSGTTWKQASFVTWDDLETWEQPLIASIKVRTDTFTEAPVKRKLIKFLKTLRFRQIYYYIEMWSDGSTVTGPCRLFSLVTIVGSKEQVVKQVS